METTQEQEINKQIYRKFKLNTIKNNVRTIKPLLEL